MIGFSRTIQYSIWLLRRSLEYLINHKKIVRFPTLDKIAADLRWTRPASQHLVPDSFSYWEPCKLTSIFFKVLLFQIITSVIIWTGFKRAAYQFKLGAGQNNLWKEIFISTKKTHNFWKNVCFKWSRFFPSTLYSFTAYWTQTAGVFTVLNPLSSLY